MRIAVLGGAGLLGAQVCAEAESRGHTVRSLSRRTGVDVVSGAGLSASLAEVDVVVDTFSEPTSDPDKFRRVAANAQQAAAENGVRRYVLVSIVNVDDDRLSRVRHFRAKTAQEATVRSGAVPATVVRSTQWFDFAPTMIAATGRGPVVPMPQIHAQPVDSAAVARVLVDTCEAEDPLPQLDLAGPEPWWLTDMARQVLRHDRRRAVVLPVPYPGAARAMAGGIMLAPPGAIIDATRFGDWLDRRPAITDAASQS